MCEASRKVIHRGDKENKGGVIMISVDINPIKVDVGHTSPYSTPHYTILHTLPPHALHFYRRFTLFLVHLHKANPGVPLLYP